MMNYRMKVDRVAAVLAVFLMLAVLFIPISSDYDTDAAVGETYTYTISPTGTVTGMDPVGTSGDTLTSMNNENSGSWTWDENGYGPFNSFYAAFDPAQNNRMVGHLDPDDLTKLVDGTSIAGEDYNIMWCLPTVYWKISGYYLILTNDPSTGGEAYAHTIYGVDGQKHVYEYIGLGVYEASKQTVGEQTILTSFTDSTPTVNQNRDTFRNQANNQLVNTNGESQNGYAMLWNFYQWQLYRFCTLAVMGSWDSQSVIGNGNVSGGNYTHITGDLDTSGPYAGITGNNDLKMRDSVKAFIENAWGGAEDFVDGIIINNESGYYIDQKAVPNNATSANGTSVEYIAQSLPSSGYGQFTSTTHPELWGMPTSDGGSSSSGLYDKVESSSANNALYVGGDAWYGYSAGISKICTNYSPSFYDSCIGARLAFVFDDDPMAGNTVTYDHSALTSAGGNASNLATNITTPRGESLQLPDFGAVGDFTHIGWYIGGVFYEPGATYTPTGDMTIQSAWLLPSVTITFSVEGSTYATLSVPKGSTGIVFTPTDVEGIFTGWFYDPGFEDEYDPVSPITTDITLYAKGAPPLIFTTDPVADGDIVALDGQPGTISFRATDSEDFTSVLWDFGDGQVSTDLYSTHYYAEPGSYTATLTVYNNHGSDTMEFLIEVPQMAPGRGGNDLLLWVAVGLMLIVAGGLVVRRLL